MAAMKKAVKKTSAGKAKPHTTATLKSVEITWVGQKGEQKNLQVNLKKAGGIYWGNAGSIVWLGDKRRFPKAGLALSKGAPVKTSKLKSMSSATAESALCWWDEILQQWICPDEPDA